MSSQIYNGVGKISLNFEIHGNVLLLSLKNNVAYHLRNISPYIPRQDKVQIKTSIPPFELPLGDRKQISLLFESSIQTAFPIWFFFQDNEGDLQSISLMIAVPSMPLNFAAKAWDKLRYLMPVLSIARAKIPSFSAGSLTANWQILGKMTPGQEEFYLLHEFAICILGITPSKVDIYTFDDELRESIMDTLTTIPPSSANLYFNLGVYLMELQQGMLVEAPVPTLISRIKILLHIGIQLDREFPELIQIENHLANCKSIIDLPESDRDQMVNLLDCIIYRFKIPEYQEKTRPPQKTTLELKI